MEAEPEEAGSDRQQWGMVGFRSDIRTGLNDQSGPFVGTMMMLTRVRERLSIPEQVYRIFTADLSANRVEVDAESFADWGLR